MGNILLDLDMDYFNHLEDPVSVLSSLLSRVPGNIPAEIVLEHQTIIPYVCKWIRCKAMPIPFKWMHVDQHHDFYRSKKRPVDCGNFGYFMPVKYYREFVWVSQSDGERVCNDWDTMAAPWMQDRGIRVNECYHPIKISKDDRVVGMVVAISPDYVEYDELILVDMLIMIKEHFNLKSIPLPKKRKRGDEHFEERKWICSWHRHASKQVYEWRKMLQNHIFGLE